MKKRFPFPCTIAQAQGDEDRPRAARIAYKKPGEDWKKAGFCPVIIDEARELTFCDACYDIGELSYVGDPLNEPRRLEKIPEGESIDDYGMKRLAEFESQVCDAILRGETSGRATAGNLGVYVWQLALVDNDELDRFFRWAGNPYVTPEEYAALVRAAEQAFARYEEPRAERIVAKLVLSRGFVDGYRPRREHAGDLALQAMTDATAGVRI